VQQVEKQRDDDNDRKFRLQERFQRIPESQFRAGCRFPQAFDRCARSVQQLQQADRN